MLQRGKIASSSPGEGSRQSCTSPPIPKCSFTPQVHGQGTLCQWPGPFNSGSVGYEEQNGGRNKQKAVCVGGNFPDGLNDSLRYRASHKLLRERGLFCAYRLQANACRCNDMLRGLVPVLGTPCCSSQGFYGAFHN